MSQPELFVNPMRELGFHDHPPYQLEDPEPLVTAIICNYNYGRYLPQAIESALGQTWKPLEVIVVDDGSTDKSREILGRYREKIKVILKENGGQASAFNVGIREARGEIICFLDSDDYWHPNKVDRVVAKYLEAPWGLVCNDVHLVDEVGRSFTNMTWSKFAKVHLHSGYLLNEVIEQGYPWLFSPTTGMSLPRNLARRITPLPEREWRICADTPLAYSAICHGHVGVIKEPLGSYRIHDTNSFAAMHGDSVATRLVLLIHPVRRYLFLGDYLKGLGQNLNIAPKDNYFYYRDWVLVATRRPWRYLPHLYKRNLNVLKKLPRKNLSSIRMLKFLLLDTFVSLAILVHLPIRYFRCRERFRREVELLDPQTATYLTSEHRQP